MEFNDLKIFQTVAKYGSVSKAALELNYVQSNVTARIKLLEKELRTPLFYRHKRGMTLNPEGKRLLEQSRVILSGIEEMKRTFQDKSNPSGVLEIGIVETVMALPDILASYYSKYPNVELSLKAGVTDLLVQQVIDMKLDGAFVTGPIKHPLIEQVEVIQEKMVLVTKEKSFSIEEMTKKPLLLYKKGCGYRERLESWMKAEGIIPKQIMEFGTFGTIIGSVAAGIGITIIPESSITDMVANGTVFCHSVPEPYHEITTIFIRRKDSYITSTLQCFMDEIVARTRLEHE
ncbi:DNA-binding transcriptional regulator, LysR family [Paenibacillus uliginis N3/975]|uniref:DNA-binding transcriptional regulator, LysR family n=1 Tax=Paenibacillus uliginis N3/975 TaxID=1313296 RepID=A0A1X7HV08_9BACL|nr:LysR family transcriptional regulator [Paenibacillus uliginis]SMF92966.1 DNA-binding transcriptional regulator, LysR family [Paenibacillus uliginis N3/975]